MQNEIDCKEIKSLYLKQYKLQPNHVETASSFKKNENRKSNNFKKERK